MSELRFDDRVAVVTGAGRGMGRCHALLLASKGAKVVVADVGAELDGSGVDAGPAQEVVDEITAAGGEAVAAVASVADETQAASIVDAAIDTWGRLDIVVNNAGISDPADFGELTLDQFRRMIDVHYLGTVYVTKAAWPHILAAGHGRIVFTTSEAIIAGIPGLTSYGAAKGAVFGVFRNLATEAALMGDDIRVNAIAPRGNTRMAQADTPRLMAKMPGGDPEVLQKVMSAMRPELVSPAIAYLAHESCTLNGETFVVGAGAISRLVIMQSQGITREEITAEDIADNIDQVLDLSGAYLRDANPFHPE